MDAGHDQAASAPRAATAGFLVAPDSTISLSAAYDQPMTVPYRTVDGTATTSDHHYVAQTRTLGLAPGETRKTITIVVNGDSKRDADETFNLELFGLITMRGSPRNGASARF